eukprot:scaffold2910_cov390-Prasinococcus_capsulatus_cf.AAC.42
MLAANRVGADAVAVHGVLEVRHLEVERVVLCPEESTRHQRCAAESRFFFRIRDKLHQGDVLARAHAQLLVGEAGRHDGEVREATAARPHQRPELHVGLVASWHDVLRPRTRLLAESKPARWPPHVMPRGVVHRAARSTQHAGRLPPVLRPPGVPAIDSDARRDTESVVRLTYAEQSR